MPVDENKLNKKPLEDFGGLVLAKLADKKTKLDLSNEFKVVMEGTITKDGKLDRDPKISAGGSISSGLYPICRL